MLIKRRTWIRRRKRMRTVYQQPLSSSYRPKLELLEARLMLSGANVMEVYPPMGFPAAAAGSDVIVRYDQSVDASTVTDRTLVIHGLQSGQITGTSGIMAGDTVVLSPSRPFHTGEQVQATATTGIRNLAGEESSAPFVWQFHTAASGGTGVFVDTGQSLGALDSNRVALGDLDGDGDLDAFVAYSGEYGNEPNRVWFNDGSGSFSDSGQELGKSNSQSVALGDLDGDGDLDAFVVNGGEDQADKVWLNDATGHFSESGQDLGGESDDSGRDVVLGDLDGDGDLDAFVAEGYNSHRIWQNDGTGRFADSLAVVGGTATKVVLGDVDADGDLDVLACRSGEYRSALDRTLWLNESNDGALAFVASNQQFTGNEGDFLALGDVDGDGDLDALFGGLFSIQVWLNDATGSFVESPQLLPGAAGGGTLGDVDGDHDLDLVAVDRIIINDGLGNFQDTGQNLGGGNVVLADLNTDGALDLFQFGVGPNQVWLNRMGPVADLAVTVDDGARDASSGDELTYTITVSNHGPTDVVHAAVTVDFPPVLTDVEWTCTTSGGSSCPGDGVGSIDEFIDLPAGGEVTFVAMATLAPDATTPSGIFTVTADVQCPEEMIDRFSNNNSKSDTDRLPDVYVPVPNAHPGLTFSYDTYSAAGEITAISHGDIDGDGWLDLLAVDRDAKELLVLHGSGHGSFAEEATRFAIGAEAVHVVAGDLNNDGDLDVVVTGGGVENPTFTVLLNAGWLEGNWLGLASPTSNVAEANPTETLIGDWDRDGNLDLAVASSQSVAVHHGNGDGTFNAAVHYAVGDASRQVAMGDFDGDGNFDLVVAVSTGEGLPFGSGGDGQISLLLGQGDGTFEEQSPPNALSHSLADMVVGDIDDDGDLDLALASNYSFGDPMSIMLNDGDGTFAREHPLESPTMAPTGLALGDFNADGHIDIAVISTDVFHGPSGGLHFYLGRADGGFEYPIRADYTSSNGLVAADFDADGRMDLVTSNWGGVDIRRSIANTIFASSPDSYLLNPDRQGQARSVEVVDLNHDGHLDMLVTDDMGLFVLLGNGAGRFHDAVRYNMADSYVGTFQTTDLNGDGQLDAVAVIRGDNEVGVLLGDGLGGFGDQVRYAVGTDPRSLQIVDLNGDDWLDLVTLNDNSRDISVLLGDGMGGFAEQVRYAVGMDPGSPQIVDLNGDDRLDLVILNNDSNKVSVLINDGTGGFGNLIHHAVGADPRSLQIVDLNGDDRLDLVTLNNGSNNVSVLLNDGLGGFASQVRYTVGADPRYLEVVDLNGDDRLDLVTLNSDSNNVSVLLNDGTGGFGNPIHHAVGADPRSLQIANLNGDSQPDLIVHADGGASVLLSDGAGGFAEADRYVTENMWWYSTQLSDLNGDDQVDLITWNDYAVGTWLGESDGTFTFLGMHYVFSEYYGGSEPKLTDLDGDGNLDLLFPGGVSTALLLGEGDGTFAAPWVLTGISGPILAVGDIDDDADLDLVFSGYAYEYGVYGAPVCVQVMRNITSDLQRTPGDFDGNQFFDGFDFLLWQRGFGTEMGALPPDGDADGDGDVDAADLAIWQSRFGECVESEGEAAPIISEIMYHPQSDDTGEEYIELFNPGGRDIDLTGWRFTDGVDFEFPQVTLAAGDYLVVAADVVAFSEKYPGVANVVGGWSGRLSNRGEDIELEDAAGRLIDQVHYSDEGEWAVRVEGELDHGHRGWRWLAEHDGDGRSLELINLGLPNEYGQNWGASLVPEGTPGTANSVAVANSAPLVVDVGHLPVIPRSFDPVIVTARVLDDTEGKVTVTVHYRVDGAADYETAAMQDDGMHGDGEAGDGLYGATIPPQPDATIVEIYIQASDNEGQLREWPAVVETADGRRANLLYQVLDAPEAHANWNPESQPITYLIMTNAERAELADIGDGPASEAASNAKMNGTLIRLDGTGIETRYLVGIRNRGGNSRVGPPNNYRVNVPHDRPVDGDSRLSLNAGYIYADILGSAIYRLAGMPAAQASAVRVRINGHDLAEPGGPRMYGAYSDLEVIDSQFPDHHFADDPQGNLYRGFLQGSESGDFRYEGPDPDAYRDTYSKETNEDEDDWSDLIRLTDVLNNTPDASFLDELQEVIDLQQWMRFFALDALLGNLEFGLNTGAGDNYWLYRGVNDPRFVIIPHDLDTILGRDRLPQPNRSIFGYTDVAGLSRLFTHPDTAGLYYQAFVDLIDTVFNPETLNPLFDQFLTGFIPAEEIAELKQFVIDRTAGVLAQIPRQFTASSRLPVQGGYFRTIQPAAELEGTADAVRTRSVTVGGEPAEWSSLTGQWSINAVGEGRTDVLVTLGASWRFLDDGSDQGDAWQAPTFDDSNWNMGPAPLGYGRPDQATVVSFGSNPNNKFITTYFRHEFVASSVDQINGLTLTLDRDDGAIVYLNGQEVVRSNLPDGTIDSQTVASTWIGGALEDQLLTFPVDPQFLQEGSNVLAVEIHQRSGIDSDIRLDLSLEATVGTIAGGVPLSPGINRIVVQAFDGPNGTGNVVQHDYVDIWYDGSASSSIPGDYNDDWYVDEQDFAVWATTFGQEVAVAGTGADGNGDGLVDGSDFLLLQRHLSTAANPLGVLAPAVIAAGQLTEDTFLAPSGSAYRITGDVIVPEGVTLTILAGTTVFFEENTGITIDGGTLVAEGNPFQQIRLTRVPGADVSWDGIQFVGTTQDNRIAHAIVEYGVTEDGMIGLQDSNLFLDHVTLDHTDRFRVRSVDSSLIVRNSMFTDIFAAGEPPSTDNRSEHIWASGIPANGWFIIEDNYFGTTKGHNDAIDIDGAQRPNPIPIIRNNIFAGSGDDALDLEADAYVEHNLFMNIIKDVYNTNSGDANAISAGAGREYTVVRNVFMNVDHAVQVKDDAFLTFVNNTVFDTHISAIYFELVDRDPGRGALVEDSIFANTSVAFDAVRPETDLTVNRSIVPADAIGLGIGNLDEDPRLAAPDAGDFTLRPGSPALNAGRGGRDMGAEVEGGVFVFGEPPAVTSATYATLQVAGAGITHYRYRLHDGPWSAEISVDTAIELTGLVDGDYVVMAVGKDSAGLWQDEQDAATSSVWTVATSSPHVRINEVLAFNNGAVEIGGEFPDLVELYNDGDQAVDLAGMSISDDLAQPSKYVFPADTVLDAGEFLVLIADEGSDAQAIHLGFALGGDGEGLHLFDSPVRQSTLLDSVQFGIQVPDLSIGRTGHDGTWSLNVPTFGGANVGQPTGDPSTLRINEWLASHTVRLSDDFVELYNPDPLPVALGGLYVTDDPFARPTRHQIAPLSYIAGGGWTSFRADAVVSAGADHLSFRLSASQELVALLDAQFGIIDAVLYHWQTTDVSQGRSPDGGDQLAFFQLPTPGTANPVYTTSAVNLVALSDEWAYDESGEDLGVAWRDPTFDDSAWPIGAGVLGADDGGLPAPIETELNTGIITYYFRKHVTVEGDPADSSFDLTTLVDDGAVVYVNGAEALRLGLPDGDVAYDTTANRGVGNAQLEGPFTIPSEFFVSGDNVIAVEVHQLTASSNDVVFGLTLDAHTTTTDPATLNALALLDGLRVTEIMYNPAGGQELEYIEIQNVGSDTLDLSGVRIDGGIRFVFPPMILAPDEYVVVVENLVEFTAHYGAGVNLAGHYAGRLSNGGEEIELLLPAPQEVAILDFAYDDAWYPSSDGEGKSIEIVNPAAQPQTWSDSTSWQPSLGDGGSPGFGLTEFLPGDFDTDGDVDGNDFLAWKVGFGTPSGANLEDGDADADGDVDGNDFLVWQTQFGSGTQGDLVSDVNSDGLIDGDDLLPWQAGSGIQSGASRAKGDADSNDFLVWQIGFGSAAAAAGASHTVASTVEPLVMSPPARGGEFKTDIPPGLPILRSCVVDSGAEQAGIRDRIVSRSTNWKTLLFDDDLLGDLARMLVELDIESDHAAAKR